MQTPLQPPDLLNIRVPPAVPPRARETSLNRSQVSFPHKDKDTNTGKYKDKYKYKDRTKGQGQQPQVRSCAQVCLPDEDKDKCTFEVIAIVDGGCQLSK